MHCRVTPQARDLWGLVRSCPPPSPGACGQGVSSPQGAAGLPGDPGFPGLRGEKGQQVRDGSLCPPRPGPTAPRKQPLGESRSTGGRAVVGRGRGALPSVPGKGKDETALLRELGQRTGTERALWKGCRLSRRHSWSRGGGVVCLLPVVRCFSLTGRPSPGSLAAC